MNITAQNAEVKRYIADLYATAVSRHLSEKQFEDSIDFYITGLKEKSSNPNVSSKGLYAYARQFAGDAFQVDSELRRAFKIIHKRPNLTTIGENFDETTENAIKLKAIEIVKARKSAEEAAKEIDERIRRNEIRTPAAGNIFFIFSHERICSYCQSNAFLPWCFLCR